MQLHRPGHLDGYSVCVRVFIQGVSLINGQTVTPDGGDQGRSRNPMIEGSHVTPFKFWLILVKDDKTL